MKIDVNLVAQNVCRELIVLHNLLISDEIAPELVPTLEAGGVLELIQIYLKSECAIKVLLSLVKYLVVQEHGEITF